jgi:hypothetical protein
MNGLWVLIVALCTEPLFAQVEAPPDFENPPQIELPTDFDPGATPEDEDDNEEEEAAAAAVAIAAALCYGVFLLGTIAVGIFIIYLLYTCFQRIPPQHRLMEPAMVWLMLIPLFNIVWQFFVFIRLSRSFQQYFASKGRTDVGDCGEALGLWGLILNLIGCFPVGVVLLIIYLVKVTSLKKQIPVGAVA